MENRHNGYICIMRADGSSVTFGEPPEQLFYRSAAKPIQVLPFLMHELDLTYRLNDAEIAIMAGSHAGFPFHIELLRQLFEKTGLSEDDMVMNPCLPDCGAPAGTVPRRFFHCCAGKHACMMLLNRLLCGTDKGYERPDSPASQEIRRTIAVMAGIDPDTVTLGTDGCGVPVFAVSLPEMARSYLRLASPCLIPDPEMAKAAEKISRAITLHPEMMRGPGYLCTEINRDPNIIAKGGAMGVYTFALKKEKLGISLKIEDGNEETWPIIIRGILDDLGYREPDTLQLLDSVSPFHILNARGEIVGERKRAFHLFS